MTYLRLVQDCAILVDMGSSSGENFFAKSCIWRIIQIVGFDEVTSAHTVRYASDHPSGADYILEPTSHFSVDSLHFDGREAKLILAARDYSILKRFKQPGNKFFAAESEPNYTAQVHLFTCTGIHLNFDKILF